MATPKRSTFQRERDLEETAGMYLRGETQQAIAEHLNGKYYLADPLSRQQIAYDLKAIQGRWLKSSLINFTAARARELAKIDNLERTYWDAWERSKLSARKRVKKDTPKGDVLELTTELRVGNPNYLAGVQWCIGKRCQILGLDADERSLIDWRAEVIRLLKSGTVTPDDVLHELGQDLATDLFVSAGIPVAPGGAAESPGESGAAA